MRMFVVFEKRERLRHIGHLDILRTMQRALRRSGLPIAYSKGFNPHMLIGFASALSVGASGENELMEIELTEDFSAEEVCQKLAPALPEDLSVRKAGTLDEKSPSLMAMVAAAVWRISFLEENAADIVKQMTVLLSSDTIMAVRKTKSGEKEVNIKNAIYDFHAEEESCTVMLSQEEGITCKPSMLLQGYAKTFDLPEIPRVKLTRLYLMTRTPSGALERLDSALCANS